VGVDTTDGHGNNRVSVPVVMDVDDWRVIRRCVMAFGLLRSVASSKLEHDIERGCADVGVTDPTLVDHVRERTRAHESAIMSNLSEVAGRFAEIMMSYDIQPCECETCKLELVIMEQIASCLAP